MFLIFGAILIVTADIGSCSRMSCTASPPVPHRTLASATSARPRRWDGDPWLMDRSLSAPVPRDIRVPSADA